MYTKTFYMGKFVQIFKLPWRNTYVNFIHHRDSDN